MIMSDEILKEILTELRELREEISLDNAIKRKNGHRKRLRYINFENWAANQRGFTAGILTNKFSITKKTALIWMSRFVLANSGFVLSTGRVKDHHRVVRKYSVLALSCHNLLISLSYPWMA